MIAAWYKRVAGFRVCRTLAGGLRHLAAWQANAGRLDLHRSLSTLISRGLSVLLLLVVSGVSDYLPGAGLTLFRGLTLPALLKCGLAAAAIGLLAATFPQAVCVIRHYIKAAAQVLPGAALPDAPVSRLAWNVALLVYVCLINGAMTWAIGPVLAVWTAQEWPFAVLDLLCLVAAVAAIIGIVAASMPLFGKLGDAAALRVKPQPDLPPLLECPGCGVLNPEDNRFCVYCGRKLLDPPA